MTMKLLAWCQYPEPHGTAYADEDFTDLPKLIELLDRAQVMRAYITAQGWRTLWRLYGLHGLLDLNRQGGWFDTRDKADRSPIPRRRMRSLFRRPNRRRRIRRLRPWRLRRARHKRIK